MLRTFIPLLFSCSLSSAMASEYYCTVEKKFDSENTYTKHQIEKNQFSVNVKESEKGALLSRCSFVTGADKVTCDSHQVDKVVFDEAVKIKKYYVFRSQFDVQIFKDLSFIENNGRGGVAYGKCRAETP